MTVHDVKCVRPFFGHLVAGHKSFELRKDDRGYQPGDVLILHETHDEGGGVETGRVLLRRITYKLPGGRGLAEGHCILQLGPVDPA